MKPFWNFDWTGCFLFTIGMLMATTQYSYTNSLVPGIGFIISILGLIIALYGLYRIIGSWIEDKAKKK